MKKTFKQLSLLGLLASTALFSSTTWAQDNNTVKHIAITAIVDHPALDDARYGIIDELKEHGYIEGENLKVEFQSAQGNNATAAQIAKKFVGDRPDVMVGVGTPSAQALLAASRTIPIVFTAVTDPIEAKLVKSWEAEGGNVTGVSDYLPLEPQVELIKELVPEVKSIGYVYSPGEVNATIVLKNLKEILAKEDIKIVEAPAQRTTDIPMAVRSMKDRVEVIYSSTDNNVVSAYESMYQAAVQSKILLVASDTSTVKRGAAAALGGDYYGMGRQTGKIIVRILEGEKPGDIVAQNPEATELFVNPKAAKAQGYVIPQALIERATEVIE